MAYVVKKGDNLTKIAKQNGLSLTKLLELNKQIKNPDYIQVGQKINLPSSSPTGKQLYDNNDGYPTTPVKKSSNITKPIWDKTTKGAAKIDTSANFNKTPTKTVVQKKPQSKNVKNEDVSFLQDVENDIEKYLQMAKTFINRKILTNIPGYDIGDNEKTSKINLEKPTNPENFEFIKGNKIYDQEFGKNVYHSSRYIDLNNPSIKTNVHNRGQKYDKPIPFKEILFSNFDNNVFDDIHYLKRIKKLKNDSFYMGTDVNGKLIMGYGKDIQNINGAASPFTVIKNVKGFSKNKDQFKLQKSKFANKAKDPFLLDDQNNEIPINILTSEDQDGHKKYGQYYGGSFILLSPDMKKKVLVSGSLDELDKSMEKFKKDNNLEKINVVKVDNGSYSRQFAVDQGNQIDQQFWNKYEGLNNSGGNAVYMYNNGGYVASDNIDMGYYTNPVKYFAAKGANIPTSWDNYRTKLNSKEESKFLKWRSTLPENLQNENDYDLRGYYKEYGNKPIPKGIEPHLTDEFKLPNHPTFSENSRYYNDETNYLGGKWDNGLYQWKYTPNSEFKNEVIEQKGFDELRNDFILNNHNILSRNPNIFKKYGGYAEMGFDTNDYYSAIANERPRDSATSYQQDVKGKFNWLNTLAKTPIEQIQKDIDSTPLTKNYMLNKTPKGYFNVYDRNNKPVGYSIDGKTLVPQEPNFEDGGLVRAWIQKFMKGGYIAEGGYPNGQELTQPTTNYYNWGNYNNSFSDPTALNQNPFDVNKQQMQVPMAQSNMPQNIGTNYKMDFNASNDEVNKGNAMADSMMGGKKGTGISNPMSMGMDVAGKSMNAAANLMSTFGKDNSKAKAFGLGASGAMKVSDNITKPFESIPIAGKAISAVGKTLGFIIGGALEARRQGIENEEMDKYNKVQEYTSRNMQTIQQPSYYGQYMSKYGSNIKNLEKRLMDDIYSDFDKYMKLT